ncbi:MAG: hypothetical protein II506_06000 [Lachnospiraceae bacterium]|nr:hypothetical protein [Lachnospiraceae bacterium]
MGKIRILQKRTIAYQLIIGIILLCFVSTVFFLSSDADDLGLPVGKWDENEIHYGGLTVTVRTRKDCFCVRSGVTFVGENPNLELSTYFRLEVYDESDFRITAANGTEFVSSGPCRKEERLVLNGYENGYWTAIETRNGAKRRVLWIEF